MYGRSSINSVAGGGGEGDGARDMGGGGDGRAQSLVSSSTSSSGSIGGCDSSTSSSSTSLVESGPRSSRDVRRSISSCNQQKTDNGSSCSSVDSRFAAGPRILGNPSSELYDQNILKNRASVLSQLSSVFGQRINSNSNSSIRSNSLVQQRQVKNTEIGNRISPQV